jgi:hypothetical protein
VVEQNKMVYLDLSPPLLVFHRHEGSPPVVLGNTNSNSKVDKRLLRLKRRDSLPSPVRKMY